MSSCTSLNLKEYAEVTKTSPSTTPIPHIISETTSIPKTPTTISTSENSPTIKPLLSTNTSTPLPTLTSGQKDAIRKREALLTELMAINENCQLPCWWGVQIGDTLDSVGQKLTNLIPSWNERESNLSNGDLMGSITTGYYDVDERLFYLGVSVNLYADTDKIIQYIQISVSRPSSNRGESEFIQDWQQFSLDSILQNYGKPSQVFLRIRSVADFTPTPIYSLSLFYPDKGITITYNLEGIWLDDNQLDAEFCLDMENVNPLEIALYKPNGFDTWARYFPPYDDELYEQATWENRIGMDLESFYQTYRNPNNLDCVQVLN